MVPFLFAILYIMPVKKLSKKEELIHQEAEEIELMGQENDRKASKFVIEKFDEQEKQEKEEQGKKLEELSKKRNAPKIFIYIEQLAIYLREELREEKFPEGWHWKISLDRISHGISLTIFDEKKFKKTRKFRIIGDPKYDLHACTIFAYWAGDEVLKEIDKREGKSDLILPQ